MLSIGTGPVDNSSNHKRLVKQPADSALSYSRVDREIDRYVGKTINDTRWQTMKRKYTLQSTRRNSSIEIDPELVMKIQERARSQMYGTSFARIIEDRSTRRGKVKENPEGKKFFSADKRSLDYLEN